MTKRPAASPGHAVVTSEPASTREQIPVRLALPKHTGVLGPVTARRMRRALLGYGIVWALGTLFATAGPNPAVSAFGLGLVVPGGGFFGGDSSWWGLLSFAGFVLAVLVWWAIGMIVLPPLVWLGTAALAASSADSVSAASALAIPSVAVASLLAAHLIHRVRHARQVRAAVVLDEKLARVPFTISGPPSLNEAMPVAEHTAEELAHLRHAFDLALQPLDRFDGFTIIDEYREAALRYQINTLGYALSLSQFTRTPAFSGYLAEAQQNAIEKMLHRKVWGYWARENAWGNLSLRRDPVANRENIMLTGWHGLMVGMYETLNDDRYSQRGALSYRWSDDELYPNDFGTLAESVYRNMTENEFTLFPCEPNWTYTVCNTFGINTLATHDRLHRTTAFEQLRKRLRHAYETEFLRPDGRIVGVRSTHLGLSWNFWSGVGVQLATTFWLHPSMPDIAGRTWWLLRDKLTVRPDGTLVLPRAVSDRLDPGNYQLGRDTFGLIATALAAREVGDHEYADAALRTVTEREAVEQVNGVRHYRDASPLTNMYSLLSKFNRRDGFRDLVAFGAPTAWTSGPRLADAAYPDVLVARAITDGSALDLVLRPGAGAVRTVLGLDRLRPGETYRVDGAATADVVADPTGRALVEVELEGRCEVRVRPA